MNSGRDAIRYYRKPQRAFHVLSNFIKAIDEDESIRPCIEVALNDEMVLEGIADTGKGDTTLLLGDFYLIQSLFVEASERIAANGQSALLRLEYGGCEFFPAVLIERRLGISPHAITDGRINPRQIEAIRRCFEEFKHYDLHVQASREKAFCHRDELRVWEVELLRLLKEKPDRDMYCLVGSLSELDYSEEQDDTFEVEESYVTEAIKHLSNFAQETGIRLIVGAYCDDIGNKEKLIGRFGPDVLHKGVSKIIQLGDVQFPSMENTSRYFVATLNDDEENQ